MVRPQFSLRTLLLVSITLGVVCGTYSWWSPHLKYAAKAFTPVEERPIRWQTYSPKLLAEAKQSGKPVLLFFDADWDLTTKVNLQFAVEQPEVRRLIADYDVTPIKADLTNNDKDVANEAINYHGYPSTPLMVIHDSRSWKPPIVLSGVQQPKRVALALRTACKFRSHRTTHNTFLAPFVGAVGMLLGVGLAHLLANTETRQAAGVSASSLSTSGSAPASSDSN